MTGFEDGTYRPSVIVTRAEMTVYLSRMSAPLLLAQGGASQSITEQ